MDAVRLVPALLSTVALSGCGSSDSPRERVDAYLRQATALQQEESPKFKTANEAYVAFARDELKPDEAVARLEQAEKDIAGARDRLAELSPPAEARRLHSRLVRFYDQNYAFARSTTVLARYVPGAEAALEPLDGVNSRLQKSLGKARTPKSQASALGRYVDAMNAIIRDLRDPKPPFVLRPTHMDQVNRLRRTRDVADDLRAALLGQDAKRVAGTLRRFRRTVAQRAPRRRLAAQAITQYNRRYRDLSRASADIRREEARLDRALD